MRSTLPSLSELAAEANRRRIEAQQRHTGHGHEGEIDDMNPATALRKSPWWIQVAFQFGISAVYAFILLTWLQKSVDGKLDLTLAAAQATRQGQVQIETLFTTFVQQQSSHNLELLRQTEISLLVQRQTCVNLAKTERDRRGCYATVSPREAMDAWANIMAPRLMAEPQRRTK